MPLPARKPGNLKHLAYKWLREHGVKVRKRDLTVRSSDGSPEVPDAQLTVFMPIRLYYGTASFDAWGHWVAVDLIRRLLQLKEGTYQKFDALRLVLNGHVHEPDLTRLKDMLADPHRGPNNISYLRDLRGGGKRAASCLDDSDGSVDFDAEASSSNYEVVRPLQLASPHLAGAPRNPRCPTCNSLLADGRCLDCPPTVTEASSDTAPQSASGHPVAASGHPVAASGSQMSASKCCILPVFWKIHRF